MSDDTPRKCCTKCGESFPVTAELFYHDRRRKDGFQYSCKSCHNKVAKERKKTWAQAHPDRMSSASKRFKQAHPDIYQGKYKGKYKDRERAWRRAHPEIRSMHRSKRRARERGALGSHTPEQVRDRY